MSNQLKNFDDWDDDDEESKKEAQENENLEDSEAEQIDLKKPRTQMMHI